MPKRPEAFRTLYAQGGEASRHAYGSITATASGHAFAQIASGRRSVTVQGAITDHPHRMAQALTYMLRTPQVRAELRALLDSYDEVRSSDYHVRHDDEVWHGDTYVCQCFDAATAKLLAASLNRSER